MLGVPPCPYVHVPTILKNIIITSVFLVMSQIPTQKHSHEFQEGLYANKVLESKLLPVLKPVFQ